MLIAILDLGFQFGSLLTKYVRSSDFLEGFERVRCLVLKDEPWF